MSYLVRDHITQTRSGYPTTRVLPMAPKFDPLAEAMSVVMLAEAYRAECAHPEAMSTARQILAEREGRGCNTRGKRYDTRTLPKGY